MPNKMVNMAQSPAITRQYDLWSKFYDQTFRPLVVERQRRAIEQLRLKPGDRVLDMGVGTGMSLGYFPRETRVVGLDLSAGMLREAHRKLVERHMDHISLIQGDAMQPPFRPQSFDHVLLSHVISVVPDPAALLQWAARLIRPHGRVVVINHFQSHRRPMAVLEKVLNPICIKLGWRSDVCLPKLLGNNCPLEMAYQFKLNAIDLWQVVVLIPRRGYPGYPLETDTALPAHLAAKC